MTESTLPPAGMRREPRQARSQERVKRILDVAEELFIAGGYTATTTNAIAGRAKVPIGSLYQFFPDKSAILLALARRYGELLHQELNAFDDLELAEIPLPDLVERLIDATDRFFSEHPGYHAIFMEVQGTIPELTEIEDATDDRLVRDLADSLARRHEGLETADYRAIAFVLVKAIGTLLWLSLNQERSFRKRLVAETKRFALSYLQSYFPSDSANG